MANKSGVDGAAKSKSGVDDAATELPAVDLVEAQQCFYQMIGCSARIIYDLYPTVSTLARKLKIIFDEKAISEKTRKLADVIWAQRCFVGEPNAFGVRMSPIFVFCVYDNFNMRKKITHPLNMKSNKFSLHPVFRVQKCTNESSDARCCCAIFIDELGRVYEDWSDFTENNKFDDCVVLTPKDGIYMGDERHDDVLLDVFLRKSGVTQVLDGGATVLSIAALGVTVAAAVPALTIAPIVLGGASVVGAACAGYNGIRSVCNLYDRCKHEQSISIKNKEARDAYLNLGTTVLVAGAAGASQVMSKMMQNGKNISRGVQYTVKGTQICTFGIQTVGMLDGTYTITKKLIYGDDVTLLEVAQWSTSLFLWTHSARNLGIAEKFMKISGTKNTMATKRFLLTMQKTATATLLDHRAMVMAVREMNGSTILREIQATFSFSPQNSNEMAYELSGGMEATVKIEYFRLFDTRIEEIVHKLDTHYKHNKLSALREWLIKFLCGLCNMTLKCVEHLFDYAEQMARDFVLNVKGFEKFDFVVQQIFAKLKEILKRETIQMSQNDFLIGLKNNDRRLRPYNDEIREHVSRASAHASSSSFEPEIAPTDDITDDKKLALTFEDRVDDIMNAFKKFGLEIGDRELELKETIAGICRVLESHLAETFFNITMRLIRKHRANIGKTLNRSIPIDNFLHVIFCLLDMRSEQPIQSVLAKYYNLFGVYDETDGEFHDLEKLFIDIDKEFREIYQPVNSKKKIVKCKKCSGKKCSK